MRFVITFFALNIMITALPQTSVTTDYFAEGRKAENEKNFTAAIENFKKVTAQKPTDGEAWYEIGWCYNELQKYDEAIKALINAKTYLKDAKVFFESGYANDFGNKTEDAIADYKKCIELDINYAGAYRQLANIYNELKKDYKTASYYYNEYLNHSRESDISAKTWYKKGFCENETAQYEDAIISLTKAVQADNKYAAAYTELGYAYYALKRYDEALTELNKSVNLLNAGVPNYYMGLCYVAQNQKTKAQEMYQKLLALKSPDADKLLAKINAMQ